MGQTGSETQAEASRKLAKQPSNGKPVLYVSNLPHNIAPVQVQDVFHSRAKVELGNVELLRKSCGSINKTCGLAVVSLKEGADVDAILKQTDGQLLMGRPMIVRKDKFVEDDGLYKINATS